VARWCVAAVAFVSVSCRSADPPDEKRLQGTWDAVSVKAQEPQAQAFARLRLRFADKQVAGTYRGPDDEESGGWEPNPYTLDAAKCPKEITFLVGKERREQRGIYEFQGDTLIICLAQVGQERPTDFDHERWWVVTFHRSPVK
jgi:uncharacterized protein (TIGR03067 family)